MPWVRELVKANTLQISREESYYVNIWCGQAVRGTDRVHSIQEVYNICQEYCDKVGLCVTVTPTRYIYTNGAEDGVCVRLINYPRFPSPHSEILEKALHLAKILMDKLEQMGLSVETPHYTHWLHREE